MILVLQLLWVPFLWNQYLVGQFNDDASYLALARSLALGYPYQDLFEMGAPAATRFPPGYPIILMLFSQNYWMARALSLILSLAALHCFRKEDKTAALLLAVNPFWALCSTWVMSESLFTLATILYLQSLPKTSLRWFFKGMAAALCFYIRSIGLALVPATLFWMRRRPLADRARYLLGFALAAGPHMLLSQGYAQEFTGLKPALPAYYGAALVGLPALQFTLAYYALLGIALIGLTRKHSLAASWTLCYLAVMLIWPYQDPRFAIPILPWLLLGLPRKLAPVLLAATIGLNLQLDLPARFDLPAIPAGARVASTSMLPGVYQNVPTYAQSPVDLLDKEWEWDQGLLDNRIDTLWLCPADRDLLTTFEAHYRKIGPNLFAYQPNSRAILLHSAARQALQQERYASAAWLFRQAIQKDPGKSSLHSGLASALVQLHQPEDAKRSAEKALQLDPDNFEVLSEWTL